jgi:biotin carboxyl carrier protein
VTVRLFDIELNGTRRRVALRRAGDGWIAGIDGREVGVSVVEVGGGGGGWSMLVGGPVLPPEGGSHEAEGEEHVASAFRRESYEIAFDVSPGGELIVHVNGIAVPLTVIDPGPPKCWAKAPRRGRRSEDSGSRAIVAPMPGRIVRVLVKPEEAVAARQPLVVVEAMKMENELRAPRAGTVSEVRVVEGASVEANTVLVVLK